MKKLWIGFLVFVLAVVFATSAFAGVLDSVKGFFASQAILGAITALFAILACIFGVGILRFKNPVTKLVAVYREYRDAKLKDSQGGEEVTQEEWNGIFKRIGEAVMALLAVSPTRWAKKFNNTS